MTKLTMKYIQTMHCFKRYAYRHDKYGFKRDFKLYECDDLFRMSFKTPMHEIQFKTNKNNEKL